MNRPIHLNGPVPYRPPAFLAGHWLYDADVFAAHILARSNRLRGSIELPPETKPARKRRRKS